MRRKFTVSRDDKLRATVRIVLRFTEEELKEFERQAWTEGISLNQWLYDKAHDTIYAAYLEAKGEDA